MLIEKGLLNEFGNEIEKFRGSEFARFEEEVQFIDKTIDVLDDINISRSGQSLRTKVKKYHSEPGRWLTVCYNRPKWVKDSDPELADLLFVVNYHDSTGIKERRAMLSQAKHTSGEKDNKKAWNWPIKMHQYILLHGVPIFLITRPNHGSLYSRLFWIRPQKKSFVNFSFASNFKLPFFYSVGEMDAYLKTKRGTKETQFDQEIKGDRPANVQYLYPIVKRFLTGSWGERFVYRDSIFSLIDRIYELIEFSQSQSANSLPDGGEQEVPEDGRVFGIVQFDIGPEGTNFEENDSEELRL